MKNLLVLALGAAAVLCGCSKKTTPPATTFAFTPLDCSDARETEPSGISGGQIFGTYLPRDGALGAFIYDIPTAKFTTLEKPSTLYFADPTGIFGDTMVGFGNSGSGLHGFFYDIPTGHYTLFDHPNVGKDPDHAGTLITGISADTFCGYYRDDSAIPHGFLCDRQTRRLTPIDHPLAVSPCGTCLTAISGQMLVGYYMQNGANHGFLYDLSSRQFTALDGPAGAKETQPAAISGNTIVGSFADADGIHHGFTYDLAARNFVSFDHPGRRRTPHRPAEAPFWSLLAKLMPPARRARRLWATTPRPPAPNTVLWLPCIRIHLRTSGVIGF